MLPFIFKLPPLIVSLLVVLDETRKRLKLLPIPTFTIPPVCLYAPSLFTVNPVKLPPLRLNVPLFISNEPVKLRVAALTVAPFNLIEEPALEVKPPKTLSVLEFAFKAPPAFSAKLNALNVEGPPAKLTE